MFGTNTHRFAQDGTSAALLNPGLRASGLSVRVRAVAFAATGFISNDATFKRSCDLDVLLEFCTLIKASSPKAPWERPFKTVGDTHQIPLREGIFKRPTIRLQNSGTYSG